MGFGLGLIVLDGRPFFVKHIVLQPNRHPRFQRHFAGFDIGATIQLGGDLRQLLPHLLLSLAVDGFLLLLADRRIKAHSIPGLPATVGTFADGSRPLRIFLCFARHIVSFPGC